VSVWKSSQPLSADQEARIGGPTCSLGELYTFVCRPVRLSTTQIEPMNEVLPRSTASRLPRRSKAGPLAPQPFGSSLRVGRPGPPRRRPPLLVTAARRSPCGDQASATPCPKGVQGAPPEAGTSVSASAIQRPSGLHCGVAKEAHEPAWQDEDEAVPPRHDLDDVELGGAQVGNGAQPAGAERGRRCAVRRPAGRRRAGEGERGPCSCGCGDCHQEDRSLQRSYISHRRPFREAYAAPRLRVTTCERELAAELSALGCEHRSGDRRSGQLAPPERPGQRRRFPGRRPRLEWARGDDRR
jgi:hypothetical protein